MNLHAFLEGFKNQITSPTGLRTLLRLRTGAQTPANRSRPLDRFYCIHSFEETVTTVASGTTYTLANQLPPGSRVLATQANYDTAIALTTATKVGVGYTTQSDLLLTSTVVVKNAKHDNLAGVAIATTPVAATSLVRANGITTVTKTSHGLLAGRKVRITAADASFCGEFTILTVPNANTFTISNPGDNATAAVPGYYTPWALVVVQPVDNDGAAAGAFTSTGNIIRVQITYAAIDPLQDA